MNIKLEFDGNEHFEALAAKRALNATNAYIALLKIREFLFSETGMEGVSDDYRAEILNIIYDSVDLNDLP